MEIRVETDVNATFINGVVYPINFLHKGRMEWYRIEKVKSMQPGAERKVGARGMIYSCVTFEGVVDETPRYCHRKLIRENDDWFYIENVQEAV